MDIVAHRGYAAAFPENTRAAFTQAGETADWIELDVRPCQTDELVVFHDERLDRLTDQTGRVVATPWETLDGVEILDSGEQILRLDDALAAIPNEVGVQIELKDLGIAERVSEILSTHDNESTLISFSPLALYEVTEADPSLDTGLVLHPGLYRDAPELGIQMASHLDCHTIHVFYDMGVSAELVSTAHDHGVSVQSGTPEEGPTETVLQQCRTAGVDFLSVDRPLETVQSG
ncbi:MAG: glycerophosphoryl diester phosphodiesterase [uncultured archaeon A07HR60]|nr:MAG: glycerophosphoryl diester phosphodiesterase [uncultured archaeon A07HR60]